MGACLAQAQTPGSWRGRRLWHAEGCRNGIVWSSAGMRLSLVVCVTVGVLRGVLQQRRGGNRGKTLLFSMITPQYHTEPWRYRNALDFTLKNWLVERESCAREDRGPGHPSPVLSALGPTFFGRGTELEGC